MATSPVGNVVLVAFPYADFSHFKKRPALVVGRAEFQNLILCQITSKKYTSKRALPLSDSDFTRGGLHRDSYIRPDKLFTVERSVVLTTMGTLKKDKISKVKATIRELFV